MQEGAYLALVKDPKRLLELFTAELKRDPELEAILGMVEPYRAMLAGDEQQLVGWLHKLVSAFHRAEAAAAANG